MRLALWVFGVERASLESSGLQSLVFRASRRVWGSVLGVHIV